MKKIYIALILLLIFINYYFGNINIFSIEKKNKAPNIAGNDILNNLINDTAGNNQIKNGTI